MYILIDIVLVRKFSKILSKLVHWFTYEKSTKIYFRIFKRICWLLVIVTGDTATNLNVRLLSNFFGKIHNRNLVKCMYSVRMVTGSNPLSDKISGLPDWTKAQMTPLFQRFIILLISCKFWLNILHFYFAYQSPAFGQSIFKWSTLIIITKCWNFWSQRCS